MRFLHFDKSGNNYVTTYNVSKTVLTWCIPLTAKSALVGAINEQSLKDLKNAHDTRVAEGRDKDNNTYINITLLDENGKCVAQTVETVIFQKKKQGDFVRINTTKLCAQLQDLFWFTAAKVILNEGKPKDEVIKYDNTNFTEMISIEPVGNNEPELSGIVIKPHAKVSPEMQYMSDDLSETQLQNDIQNLLQSLKSIMQANIFRLHAYGEKEKSNTNKILSAGKWKDASEFEGIDTSLENCIYYLASDPDEINPSYLYIGEAKNSGGRLCRKIIDGRAYIGHRERDDDYYKYKFTRYRIDQISSLEALHNAQDALIGAFEMSDSSVFKNGFTLTNAQYTKAYSKVKNKKS